MGDSGPFKASHPIPIGDSYEIGRILRFSSPIDLERHVMTLHQYFEDNTFLKESENQKKLSEALKFFNFDIDVAYDRDSYTEYEEYTVNAPQGPASTPSLINITHNFAKEPDFFDLVRTLDDLLARISQYIKAVNNPTKLTADVRAVCSYIDAYRVFLNTDRPDLIADEVPISLPGQLLRKLREVDWYKFSDSVREWVETAIKIIPKMFP
ncbi:MAG: hypothetical protein ACXW1Q_09080 [Halobacteriota archaeon]